MSIEEFAPSIESSEWLWNSVEAWNLESAEKYREKEKKAQQWVQRTQKDEKKAKKYDFVLAGFLVKIILDKKYDFILVRLFKASDFWYTSNFIVWILSLINVEISNKIREYSNKPFIEFEYKNNENLKFDDSNLPSEVKNRINYWIEDIIDSVTIEYSSIQTQKIISCLEKDKWVIQDYIVNVLNFFLNSVSISASKNSLNWISNFIISEVYKRIKKLEIQEI